MNIDEYVYKYTRAQAIEDGALIEVDEKIATEAGFKVPVALTSAIYHKYVYWTEGDNERQTYQDESGRLWDLLYMCAFYFRVAKEQGKAHEWLVFPLSVIIRDEQSRAQRSKNVKVKAILHAGDNFEAVLTLMLPNED